MANIATEIKNFLSAIYGKDVRASLVSMAEKLNYEVENNTTVAKNAANSANEAASNANEAAANANEATERANTAASEAEDAAINANEAAERVKDTPVAKIEEEVARVKSDFTEHESAKNPHGMTASDVGALPNTGGMLNGGLTIDNSQGVTTQNGTNRVQVYESNGVGFFCHFDAESNRRSLRLFSKSRKALKEALYLDTSEIDGGSVSYNIYGEHNKPSGSYTGNGSATNRTINTGGIGSMCIIYGAYWNTIAMYYGAICFSNTGDDTVKTTTPEEINFRSGVLTIASDSAIYNANGYAFSWEVK